METTKHFDLINQLSDSAKNTIERLYCENFGKKISDIDDDELSEVVSYLGTQYEAPLTQKLTDGEECDKELLSEVESVITEITTNPLW